MSRVASHMPNRVAERISSPSPARTIPLKAVADETRRRSPRVFLEPKQSSRVVDGGCRTQGGHPRVRAVAYFYPSIEDPFVFSVGQQRQAIQ